MLSDVVANKERSIEADAVEADAVEADAVVRMPSYECRRTDAVVRMPSYGCRLGRIQLMTDEERRCCQMWRQLQ